MAESEAATTRRLVTCVMGANSLRYAKSCLASLIRNVAEPIELVVITDTAKDVTAVSAALTDVDPERGSAWRVIDKTEVDRAAETLLAGYPRVRTFRDGHPCWRKITDPAIIAGERPVIIIDPDVYFPNSFTFEPVAPGSVLLMWQGPNCLLPEDVVTRAFDNGLALADHTDIGVAHLQGLNWAVLEEVLEKLGDLSDSVWSMHVESIVWAALAMRMNGGYLDATGWHCFANSVPRRLARKLGRDGLSVLREVDLKNAKCFHAGGIAKNWLVDAEKAGFFAQPGDLTRPTKVAPYVPFTRGKFERKFAIRRLIGKLGLYRLIGQ